MSLGLHSDGSKLYPTKAIPFVELSQQKNSALHCGWGKLIFSHTYSSVEGLISEIETETTQERNIAFYINEPHVILSQSPQALFLDPSHTYRANLKKIEESSIKHKSRLFTIRRVKTRRDAIEVNRLYTNCGMVTVPIEFIWKHRQSKTIYHFVAEDVETGTIIGTVTGVDHVAAYGDETNGSSLWCLAVDHQSCHPRVGTSLVETIINLFKKKQRNYLDLSVLHNNGSAIELYEKMGFEKVPVFAVKRKNSFNEPLFIGTELSEPLNPYSKIIIKEARKRGIGIAILDSEENMFELTCGGAAVTCKESLSTLTSSIALMRCQNKSLTRKICEQHGLTVPNQIKFTTFDAALLFLETEKSCVVKPLDSEQGRGISIDVQSEAELKHAIELAQSVSSDVLIERFYNGKDLRVVVIGNQVVAAAIRKPPVIFGDGKSTIKTLIEKQSRRREAATHGESFIPLDTETKRTIALSGYELQSILELNKKLIVRKMANLHTGGTMHDVTDKLHPKLSEAALIAASVIEIPVVGLDFIVPSLDMPDYIFIEANERPGLANHEPQPTAEKFIDLLFPQTKLF